MNPPFRLLVPYNYAAQLLSNGQIINFKIDPEYQYLDRIN